MDDDSTVAQRPRIPQIRVSNTRLAQAASDCAPSVDVLPIFDVKQQSVRNPARMGANQPKSTSSTSMDISIKDSLAGGALARDYTRPSERHLQNLVKATKLRILIFVTWGRYGKGAIAQYQTTPLLLEVYATPPRESRDPNQPIANFRCISVAPEEARFSWVTSAKITLSDKIFLTLSDLEIVKIHVAMITQILGNVDLKNVTLISMSVRKNISVSSKHARSHCPKLKLDLVKKWNHIIFNA
ncbi:hypothetical protein WN51_11913 [Melipona quadrifasciata]|uniref:Uncharacterized protein n=1 Tax=Melipona quadrifasciata TaxID=166423 RepID=A0A0M9A568_9HYME|nr:hypothetical protein WN51_11913 [Melipona quadrifasciata]